MNGPPAALLAILGLLAPAWAGCIAPGLDAPGALDMALQASLCETPCATLVDGPRGFLQEAPLAGHPHDPHQRAIVLYEDRPDWTTYATWFSVAVTRDGGASWTKRPLPGGPFADPRHPLAGFNQARYPSIAMGLDGEIVVSGWAYARAFTPRVGEVAPNSAWAPRHATFVATSTDGGATFPHVTVVVDGGGLGLTEPVAARFVAATQSWVALAPDGSFLLAHILKQETARTPPTGAVGPSFDGVVARRSTDGGKTWSEPEVVATGDRLQPRAVVGASGTEYVLIHDPTNAPPRPPGVNPRP